MSEAREKFLDDKQENDAFNSEVQTTTAKYKPEEQAIIINTIRAYKPICPLWNYNIARKVLSIARLEYQYSLKLIDLEDSDKAISRDNAQTLSYLSDAIEKEKKQIGIDPKSLKNMGDGSIAEAFADIVEKGKFDKHRTVCKVVIGEGKAKGQDDTVVAGANEFKDMSEKDIETFLQTAEA